MNRCHTAVALIVAAVIVGSCSSDPDAADDPTTTNPTTTNPTTTSSPPATTAPAEPGDEWIAYQHDTGLRFEIYVAFADGSGAHAVAHDLKGSNQTNPDWSPDGERLVFPMTSDGGQDDLWTVDVAGGQPTMLLDCAGDCVWLDDPAWSPDGSKVVYGRLATSGGTSVGTLETVDVATGTVDVLATGTGNDLYSGPRWSPDGSSIVAEVVHRSGPSVLADVTGVVLSVFELGPAPVIRPLTEPDLFAVTADWSPDGSTIVYSALPAAGAASPDLFTLRPDGSGITRLTHLADDGSSAIQPTFAPDSDEVVFVGAIVPGGDEQLLSVPEGGGEVTAAMAAPVVGYHPRIRPSSDA